jgi:glycosyltransferase involved in cell wall biosynthesis
MDDFELIVVDDCSTDGSLAVARSYADDRVRVLVNPSNLGAPANWDRSLREARGKYVKLLHGDDLLYPACLENQVHALEAAPDAVLAASRRDIIDSAGRVLLRERGLTGMAGVVAGPVAIRRAVRSGTNPLGEPCAVLVRGEILNRVGHFRAVAGYMVDLDMWCRMLSLGDLYADQSVLCAFRVHAQSWSEELGRRQSQQAQTLWFELWREDPQLIGGRDVLEGAVKSWSLSLARRASYLSLHGLPRARAAVRPRVDPVAPS